MYTVDLYLRVRLACHVDGLSQREAASRFGIARETVKKMLRHSEPPGYRRHQPPKRPKLDLSIPKIPSGRIRRDSEHCDMIWIDQPSLLAGLIYDDAGEPMTPSHANKKGRR